MNKEERKEEQAAEEAVIQEYEREYGLTFGEESPLDPRSGKFSNPETILFQLAVRLTRENGELKERVSSLEREREELRKELRRRKKFDTQQTDGNETG